MGRKIKQAQSPRTHGFMKVVSSLTFILSISTDRGADLDSCVSEREMGEANKWASDE